MTYDKPRLVPLEKATIAIQGDKCESPLPDAGIFDLSPSAYQADE